jgi:hypothetical protein
VPTYVLPFLDENGLRQELPLDDLSLGYQHAVYLDELDVEQELASDPPEDPPVGRFPYLDENDVLAFLDFEASGGTVTDGPMVLLAGPITRTLDFARRTIIAQIGDTPLVAIDLRDDLNTPTLAGATLEIILRRGDGSALVRNATEDPQTPGRVLAQLQPGDVQSAGTWVGQAHVVFPDATEFRSRPRHFEVLHNLPTS